MTADPILSTVQRAFLAASRRAVLVTIARDGRPRPVPICFVLSDDAPVLYTPIDDKPKRDPDPMALARVRDIGADPRVSLLVDRWDDDWTRLGWVRGVGRARLMGQVDPPEAAERATAIGALRSKYPTYADHALERRPLIRIELERVTSWGALDAGGS